MAEHGADGPARRSSSVSRGVVDGATANSLAADRRGPRQDDQAVKTKLLTGSCSRILDQGLGSTRARASRNRPLEPLCTRLGWLKGGLDIPAPCAEPGSLQREHPLRTLMRRLGHALGKSEMLSRLTSLAPLRRCAARSPSADRRDPGHSAVPEGMVGRFPEAPIP